MKEIVENQWPVVKALDAIEQAATPYAPKFWAFWRQ
jgi:hypothetical protein